MTHSALPHRRTHNLMLISKLFNGRDNASPFTLVIDSLEQSSRMVVLEYARRAKALRKQVILVCFETLQQYQGVDVMVHAANHDLEETRRKIISLTKSSVQDSLVIFDTLLPVASAPGVNLASFLSSLISSTSSLLAVYHLDTPLDHSHSSPYFPHPFTLLKHLATTLYTLHSISHTIAEKSARQRSLPRPAFGLAEETEGVIVGLGANDQRGTVIEMEHRRKSGRSIREWYFLPTRRGQSTTPSNPSEKESIILLKDHHLYRTLSVRAAHEDVDENVLGSTFDLSLTEKQRRDREGVVLPYLDAQNERGVGEGGRIIYDMGVEDDFDEEEDEI